MKKCSVCGLESPDDRIFCPECGTKLTEISAVQEPQQGSVPAGGPAPQQGPAPAGGPAPQQGSAPAGGPAPQQGAVPSQGSAPRQGFVPQQNPMPQQKPLPPQMPASPQAFGSGQKSVQDSASKAAPKRFWPIVTLIVILLSLVYVVFSFYKIGDYSERLSSLQQTESRTRRESEQAKNELEKAKNELAECQNELGQTQIDLALAEGVLERFDGLQGLYGYGSANFYAEQSVVVLRKGESKDATIYFDLGGTVTRKSDVGITAKWGEKWSQHKIKLTITGNSAGFYTIHFTNDQNSDSFDILVIVTDY